MKERDARTKEMISNFFKMKQDGCSIADIARYYGLTTKTVRHYLQEIADNNGLSRDDLLDRPRKPYEATGTNNRKVLKEIGIEAIEEMFSSMMNNIDNIVSILDGFLEENKAIMEEHNGQSGF